MSRELTVFNSDFSYDGLLKALKSARKNGDKKAQVAFTLEFFPEEGKYHYTGHRNCHVRHSPSESAKLGIICPNCKKNLTIGVMHRVEQLADKQRVEGYQTKGRPAFKRLVPLLEILAEAKGVAVNSDKVHEEYKKLVSRLGSEMNILLKAPLSDLEKVASIYRVVEGIDKVRRGDIVVEPGYDGVFGVVRIWPAPSGTTQVGPSQTKPKEIIKQADGQAKMDLD